MKISDKKIKAYALKNAIHHNGKANQGSVISALFNEGLKKSEIKNYAKKVGEIISEVNSLNLEEQKKEFVKLKNKVSEREVREGLQELPNVGKKGVIMRFAPSASGPMQIGHIITSCLSFLYVKKYGGKFYFRIEDTNPENIYKPAYKMLREEAKWLFKGLAKFEVQSDNLETYYKYSEKLIKKEAAYVCACSGDKFRELSLKKKDCPCRKNNVKDNLEKWGKMLSKKGFKATLNLSFKFLIL